jgi:hypothetical protein
MIFIAVPGDSRCILSGVRHILGAYRITVHRGVVESRQVDGGDNVFADIETNRVKDVLRKGSKRRHAAEQILPMSLHRP